MTSRAVIATGVAALVAAVSATSASPGTSASRACGTVKSGGATWAVVSAGVSCTAAKPLVGKLAKKPHSLYTNLGTFLGLRCVEIVGSGKREIACVSRDGRRSVYGITKKDS